MSDAHSSFLRCIETCKINYSKSCIRSERRLRPETVANVTKLAWTCRIMMQFAMQKHEETAMISIRWKLMHGFWVIAWFSSKYSQSRRCWFFMRTLTPALFSYNEFISIGNFVRELISKSMNTCAYPWIVHDTGVETPQDSPLRSLMLNWNVKHRKTTNDSSQIYFNVLHWANCILFVVSLSHSTRAAK